ncbi:MAG: GNAT family N-acetyltransferase [Rhizomicrobium sp.]
MDMAAGFPCLTVLAGFGPVLLRPVGRCDAPALTRFFEALDPADIRARFFAGRHGPPPGYVERLAQADFEHDLVLLGADAGTGALLGGARLVEGETAITVRSDLKHRGLGRLLMRRLLDHARDRGTHDVFADILPENRASLGLARDMGFAFSRSARTPNVVRAYLHL